MNRQGFSIAELLVVMGMTSVLLTVGVKLVHRLMHEQKAADRENAMHRVAQRLSTTLREDVHAANRAELGQPEDEDRQTLTLELPDERNVTYTVRNNVLERTSIRANETEHRDSYQFPENYRLQFFDVSEQRVKFTAFALPPEYLATVHRMSPLNEIDSDALRAVMHVDAPVGRDLRFLNESKDSIEP